MVLIVRPWINLWISNIWKTDLSWIVYNFDFEKTHSKHQNVPWRLYQETCIQNDHFSFHDFICHHGHFVCQREKRKCLQMAWGTWHGLWKTAWNEIYYTFWPDHNFKDCAGVQAAQINPKILSSENFYQ